MVGIAPLRYLSSASTPVIGRISEYGEAISQVQVKEGKLATRAMDVFSCLPVPPSTDTYLSLLKACHSLHYAQHIHTHLILYGIQMTGLLADHLVASYARCGAVDDAHAICHTLCEGSIFSWTSLISGYVNCGLSREALHIYQVMIYDNIKPNRYTYVCLLKACGNSKDLEQGKKLHVDAHSRGLAADIFVGNTLVSMYGKCQEIGEALEVFYHLPRRDIVSWTAIISAYVEVERAEEALLSYRQMLAENVSPNEATMAMVLNVCILLTGEEDSLEMQVGLATVMSLDVGRALHADALRKGFLSHVLLCNTLATMYSKCGALLEAEAMFRALQRPHVVSLNALISAYVEERDGRRALLLYRKMYEDGVEPELRSLASALKACSIIAVEEDAMEMAQEIGEQLHEAACQKGWPSDFVVGTALLSMYSKFGNILKAEEVFVGLQWHDIASCNAMITAYVEEGQGDKALQLFRQMQMEGMIPNELTFVVVVQACGTLKDEEEGMQSSVVALEIVKALHADAWRKGYASNVCAGNSLINVYGKLGAIDEVQVVFCALPHRSVISWTAMLSAYVEQGQGHRALQLFRQMQEEGTSPNELTFVAALQACSVLAEFGVCVGDTQSTIIATCLEIGRALHKDAQEKGYMLDHLVSTTLLCMYGKCGTIMEAESLFSSLSVRHTDSYNAMLSLYIAQGHGNKVLELYRQMQDQHVPTHYVTLMCVLQGCSEAGHVEECYQVHFTILSTGYLAISSVATSLVHAYGSCGSMVDALVVFDDIHEPHVGSWTVCATGYAGVGDSLATLQTLQNLQLSGLCPSRVTFIGVLTACSHTGLVSVGMKLFECLSREYGLTPEVKHYGTILDLFGRSGDFKRISNILRNMPIEPERVIWSCVLGACSLHGYVELAKETFEHAMKVHPEHAATYVLMSNIHAGAGLQHFEEVAVFDIAAA